MATRKFEALVRYEHDGHVTQAGKPVTLPYGSERDKEVADHLVRTGVLKVFVEEAPEEQDRSTRKKAT